MPTNFTQTGILIEKILQNYKTSDKHPKRRGNMSCYWYNNTIFGGIKDEPFIVLGPSFYKSLFYLFAVNVFVGIGINSLNRDIFFYHFLYLCMVAWNIVSIFLITLNPGLAPRNPQIHT